MSVSRPRAIARRLDDKDIFNLVVHLLRCEKAMGAACAGGRLSTHLFSSDDELPAKTAWAAASDYWIENKGLMPQRYLLEEVERRLRPTDYAGALPRVLDEVEAYFRVVPNADLRPDYSLTLLRDFILQRDVGDRIRTVAEDGFVDAKMWEELTAARKRAEFTVQESMEPFAPGRDLVTDFPIRVPTGLAFVDYVLGGGTIPGDLIGFLAPFKGGKTTLANQWAIERAKRGKHAVVFVYETAISADYMLPVNSCVTGIAKSRWELASEQSRGERDVLSFFTREEREQIEREKSRVGDRLHLISMHPGTRPGAGERGIEECSDHLKRVEDEFGEVDTFICDWLKPMADAAYRMMSVGYGKRVDLRDHLQQVMYGFKGLTDSFGCTGVVNHQSAPATFGKHKLPRSSDAAEFKSFSNFVTGCVLLGPRSREEIAPFVGEAVRNKKSGEVTFVQLEGDHSRFRHRDGAFRWTEDGEWAPTSGPAERMDSRGVGGRSRRRDNYSGRVEI